MRSSAAIATLPPPTKGRRPHTEGVPGQLVDAAPSDVLFGGHKKTSPYDPLLVQLRNAGAGKFLKFEDIRCRVSVAARAKKLGIKIVFGEQGSILWVALAKADLQASGTTSEEPKVSNSDLILQAVKTRSTAGEIVSWMRSNGAPGIGITQVDALLSSLARAGKIKLRPVGAGSKPGDQPERWVLA